MTFLFPKMGFLATINFMKTFDPEEEKKNQLRGVHRTMERLPWIVVAFVTLTVLAILLEAFLRRP